jgi:hypothetical protein
VRLGEKGGRLNLKPGHWFSIGWVLARLAGKLGRLLSTGFDGKGEKLRSTIATSESEEWLCYKGAMTTHILKLCVGCDSVEDLASWQRRRLATSRQTGPEAELMHVTRQTPRRAGFRPGSSIYWVIGGYIRARQVITGLREVRGADGILRCGLALDPELFATEPVPRRAFQGWRYLEAGEAPADLGYSAAEVHAAMPASMRRELIELRLI